MKVVVHEGHYIKIVLCMHTIDQAIIKLPSYHKLSWAVVAYWIERRTCNPRLWVRISGPAGIVGGQFISTFNTTTDVSPLSMAPNPQLLPGRVCVHCVCVHYYVLNAEHKFRAWVTILGHMSLQIQINQLVQYPVALCLCRFLLLVQIM